MLTRERKQEILTKWAKHPKDTGSAASQVALITARLTELTKHFQANPKDKYSRRGLFRIIGQRKRLLRYIKAHNSANYKKLLSELGLKKDETA